MLERGIHLVPLKQSSLWVTRHYISCWQTMCNCWNVRIKSSKGTRYKRSDRRALSVRKCSRQVRKEAVLTLGELLRESMEVRLSSLQTRRSDTVLTIPGNLVLSVGSWLKLPLVETEWGFLSVRPMASIEWLLLRITRYRERWGGGDIFRWRWPLWLRWNRPARASGLNSDH